jgi:hypothetical protein
VIEPWYTEESLCDPLGYQLLSLMAYAWLGIVTVNVLDVGEPTTHPTLNTTVGLFTVNAAGVLFPGSVRSYPTNSLVFGDTFSAPSIDPLDDQLLP